MTPEISKRIAEAPTYQKVAYAATLASVVVGAVAGAAKPSAAAEINPDSTITVESGDNLWNIVKDASGADGQELVNKVNAVAAENNLSNPSRIMPGQRISIESAEPNNPPPSKKLRYGDTIWDAVEEHYGHVNPTLVRKVAAYSGLDTQRYFAGDVVKFPQDASEQPQQAKWQIESGQTIWAVAKVVAASRGIEHQQAIREVIAANPGVNPRELQVGQRINLPNTNQTEIDGIKSGLEYLAKLDKGIPTETKQNLAATSLVTEASSQPASTPQLASEVLRNPNITIASSSNDQVKKSIEAAAQTGQTFTHTIDSGKTANVSPKLLQILQGLSKERPLTINSLTTGNHVPTSNHYRGQAVDINEDEQIFRELYENRKALGIDELIWAEAPPGTSNLKHGQPLAYGQQVIDNHRDHIHFSVIDQAPIPPVEQAPAKTAQEQPARTVQPETAPAEQTIQLSPEENAMIDSFTSLTQTKKDFLKQAIVGARVVALSRNINPAVMVAQAALESGWGTSAPHYNYFGIKAGQWKGATYDTATKEDDGQGNRYTIRDKFRAYNSPQEAFADYANMIESNSWFADAAAAHNDWRAYLAGLQNGSAKYATATNYVDSISQIVTSFHLTELTHTQP